MGNIDHSLEEEMTRRGLPMGYPRRAVRAALNTGRTDRRFDSEADRRLSIEQKGLIAAVVGLADTRTIGPHFRSLAEAHQEYLRNKTDPESMIFFARDWLPYYQAIETYLKAHAPGLSLDITDAEIYAEAVFPEVFGSEPSAVIREHYAYRPG